MALIEALEEELADLGKWLQVISNKMSVIPVRN